MGAVEARPELGADAARQLGGAQALDGVLGHLPLPLRGDGGRVHEGDPLDYLHHTETGGRDRGQGDIGIHDALVLLSNMLSSVAKRGHKLRNASLHAFFIAVKKNNTQNIKSHPKHVISYHSSYRITNIYKFTITSKK